MEVHFMGAGQTITACGIDSFTAGELHSSQHKQITSCAACKETVEFGQARQRLPLLPPKPRYEPVGKTR
jgi:hypothetical protein